MRLSSSISRIIENYLDYSNNNAINLYYSQSPANAVQEVMRQAAGIHSEFDRLKSSTFSPSASPVRDFFASTI
jgi:hypothetical protein